MSISLPTPNIAHLTEEDYEHVYEPAEDSFILLDALELDAQLIRGDKPTICVEIGSGSGIVSTFLSQLVGPSSSLVLSTDINRYACEVTLRTAKANQISLNPILCHLLDPLSSRLRNKVDILVFNPPYVPTGMTELLDTQHQKDIGGAWAGGQDGMIVTDIILDQLPDLLTPSGKMYLVTVVQNKPLEIIRKMEAKGLICKEIIKRRAGRELLSVLRISRELHQ
ncbi:hypothetical protein I302_103630 [Kwoniella bestiolae CBS 10118]|uniref:Methyltransferase small domain-containing protein n=1 Tax=Kwoniella bestiolae CBS 10118 TaxID=1296100 RepID=A0A1B9G8Z5_9TREE|nr:hypothetical protein I302_02334 [Kwoniella bestiolae CBS 10118]OCF27492.1 hypothetical protein I302_02334 [Kwoniella bestiolae CBS 10118]